MARIKFGAIITEASGSLGGHTIQHSKGGMQIRTKPKPTESFNNLQYQIRRKIPCLQYSWKALSAIQKTTWDRYAVDHDIRAKKGDHEILSGHSIWMKYQYYNWTEECNLPVDPATASLLYPTFADYVPPIFQPIVPPVFPPHVDPPAKPTISISGYTTFCDGESVSLISSYGDFYLWSTGATTHTITVTTPGSYTVVVGNVGGLWSVPSDPVVITVNARPAPAVITVTGYLPDPVDDPNYILLITEGTYVTLTSEIAVSYIWSTGAITRSIQVSATGFYTVRVAQANGCLSSVSKRVTVQSVAPSLERGFKTRWTVAGDFTARTITLPLPANRTEGALVYNFIVKWGDGSTGHVTAWNDALKTHTYINNGTYDVEIWGTCEGWSFNSGSSCNKITHILDFGESAGFNGFKYLKNGFKGCVILESICEGGFLASGTGCLTDGFYSTFRSCYILPSVPENLFRYHPNVSTNAFRETFYQCGQLATIPSNLFRYNIAASTYAFYATFSSAYSLAAIPVDTYRYNILVSASGFTMCHHGNSSLTSLPADIFRYNVLVSSDGFYATFGGCDVLATYGANLFKYNILCTGNCFKETMDYCPVLQIRADTFYAAGESGTRFLNQSPSFENCFHRIEFTGIQGIAPDLWNCDFGTGTPYTFWCFYGDGNNIASLSNYADIPDVWKYEPG
ncbi:MAG: hypothetical protein IMZ70_02215 [Candidatus Atribacteria bacterium]|nr:hypothetical protein [Candidatus Atribacteria bacterium]